MIRYQFFPRSRGVTDEIQGVIDCFKAVEHVIDSNNTNLVSNDVLEKVRPFLEEQGYRVEIGKSADKKIDVPVLFGNNNAYSDINKMDVDFLRKYLEPAKRFIEKNPDKVLWCGEFGTIRHCNIKYRENWMRDMITILKNRYQNSL